MGVSNFVKEGEGTVKTLTVLLNSLPPVEVKIITGAESGKYLFTHRNHNIDININESRVTLDADSYIKWVIHL